MKPTRPFTEAIKAACEAEGLELLPVRVDTHPRADAVVVSLRFSCVVNGVDIAKDDVGAARSCINVLRKRAAKTFQLEDGRQKGLPGVK